MKNRKSGLQLKGCVAKIRVHANGQYLAAISRLKECDTLGIWELKNPGFQEIFLQEFQFQMPYPAIPFMAAEAHWPGKGRLRDIAFHPSEPWLAIVKQEAPLEIIHLPGCQLLRKLDSCPVMDSVGFSPCGKWAIHSSPPPTSNTDGNGRNPILHDLQQGRATPLDFETDTSYAFHPSGSILAGAWNDQGGAMIRLVEFPYEAKRRVQNWELNYWVFGLNFSPDGKSLAVVGGINYNLPFVLEIFDVLENPYPALRLRFKKEWTPQTKPAENNALEFQCPESVVFSPDGTQLFFPGECGEVVLADAMSGEVKKTWQAHGEMVTTLASDWQRGRFFTGARDGMILEWELPLINWQPK